MNSPAIYLAAQVPKLSETFVTRELLGLRAAGVELRVVSLHPPETGLEDPELEALRQEVLPVYGAGAAALLRDGLMEALTHPLHALGTLAFACGLVLTADDLRGLRDRLKPPLQAFAALALARRLRPLHPQWLHAHMAHAPTTLAMFTARQLDLPFSFTGHAADLFRDRALLRIKLRKAAFVNCISHWHRSFYQELVPRPDADYPVVRCGVDPASLPPRPARSGPLRLLSVGRLVPKKGFDVLLDSLARPEMQGEPVWELTLIGDGPEADALRRQRDAHPARDRIQLAGARGNAAVRQAMAEADIFALPCRVDAQGDRDGIPVVLMEAMAAGTAVVSGDLPAIRELVDPGRTGLLVPPGDVEALAAALAELRRDAGLRARLTEAARARIDEEFSLQVNVGRMRDLLRTHNRRSS